MSREKTRLDQLLIDRELVESRNIAQSLIIQALVLVNDMPVTKPGTLIDPSAEIRLRQSSLKFVSRAGEKLEHALDHFRIDVQGVVALDIGASTGGFTDCLLKREAKLVYAVDVGQNQLSYKLRTDPRVKVFEQTHASSLEVAMFEQLPNIAVVDVSFISIRKILEKIVSVLAVPSNLVLLVKPQFELEKDYVSKGGVVKSEKHQLLAVELVKDSALKLNLDFIGYVKSPILGAKKGNQEYLAVFSKNR